MEILARGLDLSPVHEALVEESVLGWKEFELEGMRDLRDNVIIICSIENFDPMGVHTGDSITVAPAQTLTDREYQMMRDGEISGRADPAGVRPCDARNQSRDDGEKKAGGGTASRPHARKFDPGARPEGSLSEMPDRLAA